MKTNEEVKETHLGQNIKCLMRAFGLQQYELAQKAGFSDNQLSSLLNKAEIDDATLQKVAKGLGNGVTADLIRAYRHQDTINSIINNYTQNIEQGGVGNLNNDNNSTFQEGSTQNVYNYVAEQAFALAEKNTKLEKLLLYYRMQTEPEKVKKEMESLSEEVEESNE